MIMPQVLIPVFFVLFVSVAWFITTYNRFIKYKNKIEEAWSGIDVALKRRFNLIPNLIRSVEGYSEHEANIFRTKSDYLTGSTGISTRVEKESQISKSLRGLLALAEAYPDLKASATFIAKKFGFEKQNYFALDLATQRELPEVDFSEARGSKK
jgi:LemA protein